MQKPNKPHQKHRKLVADLILLTKDGEHLEIASDITTGGDLAQRFIVQHPETKEQWRVTISVELARTMPGVVPQPMIVRASPKPVPK